MNYIFAFRFAMKVAHWNTSRLDSKSSKASSNHPRDDAKHALLRFRYAAAVLALFLLSCLTAGVCHAQVRDVVCREGTGYFEAASPTGIRVHVGASRIGELEARVCEAGLSWGDQNLVISDAASDLDIDAFGVDLGLGAPVIAVQMKKSKGECCMEYRIYSLREPPALLYKITGGEFFSAADTDLDGRVEIWTNDAAAVEGFENFVLKDLDFAPPVVLRFERGKLLDASSEFRPYFDQKISGERAKLTPQDLRDFKSSDGKLEKGSAVPAERLLHLRSVKVKVLEIVWSYLYSGREQEAMHTLAEMWPETDLDRIRAALLSARSHGIRTQLDGESTAVPRGHEIHVKIFDGTTVVSATPGITPKDAKTQVEIVSPRAILMERPPPTTVFEEELADSETLLKLVIDSAGKVRSVEAMGDPQRVDQGLIRSTASWKFIPAYSAGEPVASQIVLGVSLRR